MQTPPVALTPPARTPSIVLCLAGVIFLAAIWGFYSSDAAVKTRERDARIADSRSGANLEAQPTLEVESVLAARVPSIELIELAGVLEPIRSTWVASETAGRITEIAVAEHSKVSSGDLLVRLDAKLSEAELIRARATHQLAQNELERQERLGSRSVASEAELDRAKAEERRAYAALLEARARLAYTRIEAPFDGLVNVLDHDPGAYVQPGTRIAEILDVTNIEVTIPVSDRQIGAIEVGKDVDIRIDPLGNTIERGKIVRVGRAPQAESQRFPIVVEIPNSERKLLPGMLAHVLLEIGQTESIRIPSLAVLRAFELDYVFVLDDQNAVHKKRVRTRPVPFRPDQVEIEAGVEEGDRIVTSAISQLRDGLRVIAQ